MSPEQRKYLPTDPAAPPAQGADARPTAADQYAAWDRGDDEGHDHRVQLPPVSPPPMHEGVFGFLEVKPGKVDFLSSILWAVVYFFSAMMVCFLFLMLTQVLPAIVCVMGGMVYMSLRGQTLQAGNNKALMDLILMPTMTMAQVMVILVSVLALTLMLGRHWPRRVGVKLPSAWHFFLTLLIVPALVLLANAAYALAEKYLPSFSDILRKAVPGYPDQGADMKEMVKTFGTWPWYAAVLIIGLGPGIGEELWCRGFLGLGAFGRNGIFARVAVASFFFGLIHGDPRQGAMAAMMGVFLHYVFLTTRSLLMPMLIHFLNNSTSVIAVRFESLKAIDQEPDTIPWYLTAGAAVLLTTILISLYRTHARLATERAFERPQWEPTYPGVEHPPADCGVFVKYPRPNLLDVLLVLGGVACFGGAIAWAALVP
jgi:membrane protease YdiL (CAAX protease family)